MTKTIMNEICIDQNTSTLLKALSEAIVLFIDVIGSEETGKETDADGENSKRDDGSSKIRDKLSSGGDVSTKSGKDPRLPRKNSDDDVSKF